MSSASPTERNTAAHRLEFAMKDLELCIANVQVREGMDLNVPLYVLDLRKSVDKAIEVMTRG